MVRAIVLAVLGATCLSPPQLTASASNAAQARTLYGVSIGENASYALADLGLGPSRFHAAPAGSAQPQAEYRLALADYGRAVLQLVFDIRIKSVMVRQYGSREPDITDPYGIHLNDTVRRLTEKRGAPESIDAHHDYIYGPAAQLHWAYGTNGGRVTSISVSDGTP